MNYITSPSLFVSRILIVLIGFVCVFTFGLSICFMTINIVRIDILLLPFMGLLCFTFSSLRKIKVSRLQKLSLCYFELLKKC